MRASGKAWVFPQHDINTDLIRLEAHAHLPLAESALHSLETLDPAFARSVAPGDLLVAGRNFGCGSSRPAHASLKALGLGAIVAESFGRIFFRNCISDSLLVAPCPGILEFACTGDRLELDVEGGLVKNLTRATELRFDPLPGVLREIVACGGEKAWLKERVARGRL
jgi:3-isopropylmalate/(R)-2-methylmalate dehydratase small subunit